MNFMNLEKSELHLTIHKIKVMSWLFSLCFIFVTICFLSIELIRKAGT